MSGHPEGADSPTIQVAQGRVTGCQGIRFGGVAHVPATTDAPARIRVAVRHGTGELWADLCEGDVLDIPGDTWQVRHIYDTGRSWHASITRVPGRSSRPEQAGPEEQ